MDSANNEICQKTPNRKCSFGTNMEEFQKSFDIRRKSLEFAIEIYRHKDVFDFTDMEIPAGTADTCLFSIHQKSKLFPTYQEILDGVDIKINIESEEDFSEFCLLLLWCI